MAGGREIKTKIKSVQNTRKVTRALEMVSASKIRKAQERMKASRPYARAMKQVIGHLAQANSEYRHPYLVERANVKRVGYIVVSSDRGLAGGLNNNLFRRMLAEFRQWQQQVGVIKVMLDHYSNGSVDKVFLAYNDFVNTMTQKATFDQLLPLPASETQVARHDWDYLYEPDAQAVLEHVLTRYVESLVYQAVMENVASEHAARMVAMKAASDNANKLIETLNLVYNKARQAAITQEISEIVGGAAAV